ncbi:MAG: thiol-disulfide oxidoreductase DCC family protein [Nitrospiraceae bacterium]
MVQDSQNQGQERILIYDGQCRLCVTAKEGLERLEGIRLDGTVRFVPYQSEEAARCLGSEYRPGRPDVAFLVDADGRVSRGLDAFLPMLPGLRGGRMLLALMRFPVLRPLAYLAYRIVARYRYRWFGTVHLQDRV